MVIFKSINMRPIITIKSPRDVFLETIIFALQYVENVHNVSTYFGNKNTMSPTISGFAKRHVIQRCRTCHCSIVQNTWKHVKTHPSFVKVRRCRRAPPGCLSPDLLSLSSYNCDVHCRHPRPRAACSAAM